MSMIAPIVASFAEVCGFFSPPFLAFAKPLVGVSSSLRVLLCLCKDSAACTRIESSLDSKSVNSLLSEDSGVCTLSDCEGCGSKCPLITAALELTRLRRSAAAMEHQETRRTEQKSGTREAARTEQTKQVKDEQQPDNREEAEERRTESARTRSPAIPHRLSPFGPL